jgi:hypothetical protein
MNRARIPALPCLAACAILAGCVSTRSEVRLASPAPATGVAPTRGVAVIRTVRDERFFERVPKPGVTCTPTLGIEGSDAAKPGTEARAIARKRPGNADPWIGSPEPGWWKRLSTPHDALGPPMGDILLESDQSVAGVVRDNLAAALTQAGYAVRESPEGHFDALVIDVHVCAFWSRVRAQFWTPAVSADITTILELSGSAVATVISVHFEDSYQIVLDDAYIETVQNALAEYRRQAAEKAKTFR